MSEEGTRNDLITDELLISTFLIIFDVGLRYSNDELVKNRLGYSILLSLGND